MKFRVIEGPADLGNQFGFFHRGLLPAGRFAVVHDCEYANGGHGPATADGYAYGSREGAERAAARLNGPEPDIVAGPPSVPYQPTEPSQVPGSGWVE